MSKESFRQDISALQNSGPERSDRPQVLEEQHQHALDRVRSYPAITHAALASLILLPVAALPYIASRRYFREMRLQMKALQVKNRSFKLELDQSLEQQRAAYESRIAQAELVNSHISQEVQLLRQRLAQQNADKATQLGGLRLDVQQALNESRGSRTKQGQVLYSLGTTLADVAKFMQEVEMKFGMPDQAAPEKLRMAAAQLQVMSKQLSSEPIPERNSDAKDVNNKSD